MVIRFRRRACRSTAALLPAWIGGSLTAAEVERVRRHLAACEACRTELTAWGTIADAARTAAAREPVPSPWVLANIQSRIVRLDEAAGTGSRWAPEGQTVPVPPANPFAGTPWGRERADEPQHRLDRFRQAVGATAVLVLLVAVVGIYVVGDLMGSADDDSGSASLTPSESLSAPDSSPSVASASVARVASGVLTGLPAHAGSQLTLGRLTVEPGADSGSRPSTGPVVLAVERGGLVVRVDGEIAVTRRGADAASVADASAGVDIGAGDHITVPAGQAYVLRNEGGQPAVGLEIRVSEPGPLPGFPVGVVYEKLRGVNAKEVTPQDATIRLERGAIPSGADLAGFDVSGPAVLFVEEGTLLLAGFVGEPPEVKAAGGVLTAESTGTPAEPLVLPAGHSIVLKDEEHATAASGPGEPAAYLLLTFAPRDEQAGAESSPSSASHEGMELAASEAPATPAPTSGARLIAGDEPGANATRQPVELPFDAAFARAAADVPPPAPATERQPAAAQPDPVGNSGSEAPAAAEPPAPAESSQQAGPAPQAGPPADPGPPANAGAPPNTGAPDHAGPPPDAGPPEGGPGGPP